jgi:hypothetical protein
MTHDDSLEKQARLMVGDGKSPNLFFVSISSDYATNRMSHTNEYRAASEIYFDLPKKYAMLAVFANIEDAVLFVKSLYIPSPKEVWNNYHSAYIEDGLTGLIYKSEWFENHTGGRFPTIEFEFEFCETK